MYTFFSLVVGTMCLSKVYLLYRIQLIFHFFHFYFQAHNLQPLFHSSPTIITLSPLFCFTVNYFICLYALLTSSSFLADVAINTWINTISTGGASIFTNIVLSLHRTTFCTLSYSCIYDKCYTSFSTFSFS